MVSKKIVIVGVSASGKSTFARKLAEKTNLPLTHMDAIMWNSGWEYTGDETTNEMLKEISKDDRWIIEGYVTTDARTFLFEKADSIIYLDYSRWVCVIRYIKRWLKHRKVAREELYGSPDTFSFKFLWLVLTKGEATTLLTFLKDVERQDKIVTLHNHIEAQKFLVQI